MVNILKSEQYFLLLRFFCAILTKWGNECCEKSFLHHGNSFDIIRLKKPLHVKPFPHAAQFHTEKSK